MPGPPPKNPKTRQRTGSHVTRATLQTVEGPVTPHPLPDGDWHPEASAFWADLWDSPMVPEYAHLDARRFHMLLVLVDDFWRATKLTDRLKAAAEIRQQGSLFGLSPLDRRRLQWEIKRVEPAAAPSVPAAPARDPRLKLVG